MNYRQREWNDPRNAAGFTAECARLALVFYKGDRGSDLIATIEVVERYAAGGEISAANADIAADNAYAVYHQDAADVSYAVYDVVSSCAAFIGDYADENAYSIYDIVYYTDRAGVDAHEIRAAYARWVVRDLSCGREPPVLLRQAAGAAVVAGDEALAKEILT